jgi:hypothetical protein
MIFEIEPWPFSGAASYSIDQRLDPGRTYNYRLIFDLNGHRIFRTP